MAAVVDTAVEAFGASSVSHTILASSSLHTGGADALPDFADRSQDPGDGDVWDLAVVRYRQLLFNEVVDRYLQRVEFADNGYARLIRLPGYQGAQPPVGREPNWIQTRQGKSWFPWLRPYGPVEPWFDRTWRASDIVQCHS